METLFQTERLLVRSWTPQEDASQAFAIYGDSEVMRFIRQPDASVEAVRSRLQQTLDRYRERNNGTGSWAVLDRKTNQLLRLIEIKGIGNRE